MKKEVKQINIHFKISQKMNNTEVKTRTWYELVLDFIGDTPNGRAPEYFDSPEAAHDYWFKEYRNRNKGDGHDEYWNKIPLYIQKITQTTQHISI